MTGQRIRSSLAAALELAAALAVALMLAVLVAACGGGRSGLAKQRRAGVGVGGRIPAALQAGLRPIGHGKRFQLGVSGPVLGRCALSFGHREQAHIEVFAANRVILLAAGIGTRGPRHFLAGRLIQARCFGDLVTVDPTGVVYFRAGAGLTLGDLFRAWGEPLNATRLAAFSGGRTSAYVGGKRWRGVVSEIPLREDEEIVVEIGPHVPPHTHYLFMPPPSTLLR